MKKSFRRAGGTKSFGKVSKRRGELFRVHGTKRAESACLGMEGIFPKGEGKGKAVSHGMKMD